jgi:hypothetical protein
LIDPSQHIIGSHHYTKFSNELRIASPAENRWRFVGGLFYQRQTDLIIRIIRSPALAPRCRSTACRAPCG